MQDSESLRMGEVVTRKMVLCVCTHTYVCGQRTSWAVGLVSL